MSDQDERLRNMMLLRMPLTDAEVRDVGPSLAVIALLIFAAICFVAAIFCR